MASRIKLPGFGLPVNHCPDDHFKSALIQKDVDDGCVSLPLTTLREFSMLKAMNQITDKPDWHVFDESITTKWKTELVSEEDVGFTEKMAEWCIAELRYKAGIFETTGAISVYNGDVVKSDTVIPVSLKADLRSAVAPLENVPNRLKDWHPNSDEKVLDLVHPSLFPLVYGRSRILPNSVTNLDNCIKHCGDGEVSISPPDEEVIVPTRRGRYGQQIKTKPYSQKFQWLPCEVDISDKYNSKITSYINNLHPHQHQTLYAVIEKCINYTIPLWNMTLTPLLARYLSYNRIPYTEVKYDPDPESMGEDEGPQQEDDEGDDDYYERRAEWIRTTRQVVLPEPGEFTPPSLPKHHEHAYYEPGTKTLKADHTVDLRRDFSQTGLQIIVKLANIHLTPEKPEYDGGTWHVEGQLNEHICATALYYYENVNTTTSRLAFRQQSYDSADIEYPQHAHDWLTVVFGCDNEGPAVQNVGTVDTNEGRLLSFPNILQHQVQPFELEDPTKPGHRKLLALFLVDPNIRVISTANVPCQQREWWADTLSDAKGCGLDALPIELRTQVVNDVEDFPISLKEAKELRLELMAERSHFVVDQTASFEDNEISLCEH